MRKRMEIKKIFPSKKIFQILQEWLLSRLPFDFLKKKKTEDSTWYYSSLGYPANKLSIPHSGQDQYQFITSIDLNSIQIHAGNGGNSGSSRKWSEPKTMAGSLFFIGDEKNGTPSKAGLPTMDGANGSSPSPAVGTKPEGREKFLSGLQNKKRGMTCNGPREEPPLIRRRLNFRRTDLRRT